MHIDNLNKPLNILYIFSGDLWAGAEVMILNLLNELKGYPNCKIIALSLNEGILTDRLRSSGIETHVIPENTNSFPKILWKALRLFWGVKIDIIHSHRSKENMLALLLSKLLFKKSLVATYHGWGVEYFEKNNGNNIGLITRINYFILRHFFTRVVPVSHDIENVFVQKFRFRESRTVVVHNGIDIPKNIDSTNQPTNQSTDHIFHIGTVGRLMPQKDFVLFIEVAAMISQKMKNIRFSILGDGPLKELLVQKAKDLGIEDKVEFMPSLQNPFPYYYSLDIYLNTSLFEGIPLTILEAMACRLPVVASRVGGIPEVINDNENGILVDSRDPKVYAEKCIYLLNNQYLRNNLGNSANKTIENSFSSRHMAESYLELYKLIS
ncbi:MAG: glycosyltransferase family 4 protein [Candidatus Brocadiaceae bacterium]|nr:glycosyltransferase family 4 protein [Candidatus Brocadiaceae bacterium]